MFLCVPVASVASCDSSTLTVFVTVFTSRFVMYVYVLCAGMYMCIFVHIFVFVYMYFVLICVFFSDGVQKFYVHVVCHTFIQNSKESKKFSDIEKKTQLCKKQKKTKFSN